MRVRVILQNPESRPTTNRLASLLKVTESAACSLGDSITGRVFMTTGCLICLRRYLIER